MAKEDFFFLCLLSGATVYSGFDKLVSKASARQAIYFDGQELVPSKAFGTNNILSISQDFLAVGVKANLLRQSTLIFFL